MKRRRLGRSQISIAPLMLGGNVFGWTADEATSFRILDAFLDSGFNAVDTADVYARFIPGLKGGESESVIGNWLAQRPGRRGDVIIATKLGMDMGGDDKGLSRAYMMRAVEASLRRLQTDYIDLYQSHLDDAGTPIEETLAAYDALMRQGKVRAIGASNYKAPRIAEALSLSAGKTLPRYETLQPLYNLMEREAFEGALQDLCVKEEVGVVCYFALASGYLSGKYRSEADLTKSPRGLRMKPYLSGKGPRVLAALDHIAAEHKATPAQIALAWLMARPGVTAPIASATNTGQLEEILGAARIELSASQILQLESASGPAQAA